MPTNEWQERGGEATAAHPIWVVGKGWTDAGKLEIGDRLLAKGESKELIVIWLGLVKKQAQVYNFTVDKLHTYFVGVKQQWLVHNVYCGGLYGHTTTPGKIDYGSVDPATGQRSGTMSRITPDMVGGPRSNASRAFDPLPGWLTDRIHDRGHLHGSQLGGSGRIKSNLVTLFKDANSPYMRDFETTVKKYVQAGNVVYYRATPIYATGTFNGAPIGVTLRARGNDGFRLDVSILNRM